MKNIKINLDDYSPKQDLLPIVCQKCQKKIQAVILKDFTTYYQLWHNDDSCSEVWNYASYEHCNTLRESYERKRFADWQDLRNGTFQKVATTGGKGIISAAIVSVLSVAFGPISLIGSFITYAVTSNEIDKGTKREDTLVSKGNSYVDEGLSYKKLTLLSQ